MSEDLMSNALKAFWGAGSQTEIPQAEVDNTPEDMVEQTEFREQPGIIREAIEGSQDDDEGLSIKERIEKAMKERRQTVYNENTQSQPQPQQRQPQPQPQVRRMPQQEIEQPQSSGGFFGFAFDENIKKQFDKERGFGQPMGMAPSMNMGMGPSIMIQSSPSKLDSQFMGGMSYGRGAPMGGFGFGVGGMQPRVDPRIRRQADAALKDYEANLLLDRQAKASRLAAFNMQAMDVSRGRRAIEASQRKAINIKALESGMPVYENILDPIFGGKQKKRVPIERPTYDEKGNVTGTKIIGYNDEVVSTPGAFGWGIRGAKNIGGAGKKIFDFGAQKFKDYEIKDNTVNVLKKGSKNIKDAGKDMYKTFSDTEYRIGKDRGDLNWMDAKDITIYDTEEEAKKDPFGYVLNSKEDFMDKNFEPEESIIMPDWKPHEQTIIDTTFEDKIDKKEKDFENLKELDQYSIKTEDIIDDVLTEDVV
jgi:hypothetical protein